ncbi:MAG: ribosomal protein [Bacilli bacterium]|nr:ribosomal protein [Bacilli bacterium]
MTEELNNQDMQHADDTTSLSKGDVVSGEIIRIEEGQAIVNIGYKFEGILPIGELSAVRVAQVSDLVSVGDEVSCKVIKINDQEGTLLLSKKEADAETAWDRLEGLWQQGAVFEVKVADVVKGGLVADVGARAFIPASHVELNYVEDFTPYRGKTLRVKIIEFSREEQKVILSQKAVLEEETKAAEQSVITNIKPGEILSGTVRRITSFGVFVDIGGVDGLVHISELSWSRVDDPSTVVQVGDVIRVKVLKVDPDKGRVSLSIKEAAESPWASVREQFKEGEVVTGTVRRLTGFGAFVELTPGIEGLVHVSQVADRHVTHPKEVLEPGQQVRVKILEINPDAGRISLSIREAEAGQRPRRESKKAADKIPPVQQGTGATLGDLFGDLFKNNYSK